MNVSISLNILISKMTIICNHLIDNLCSTNPCQNGAACQEIADGSDYFCFCQQNYFGSHCENCIYSLSQKISFHFKF